MNALCSLQNSSPSRTAPDAVPVSNSLIRKGQIRCPAHDRKPALPRMEYVQLFSMIASDMRKHNPVILTPLVWYSEKIRSGPSCHLPKRRRQIRPFLKSFHRIHNGYSGASIPHENNSQPAGGIFQLSAFRWISFHIFSAFSSEMSSMLNNRP